MDGDPLKTSSGYHGSMAIQQLVTIIIPVRGDDYPDKVIDSLTQVRLENGSLQIIFVQGKAPAWQRNSAVKQALGDIIYFLDDDSCVDPDAISEGLRYFQDEKVAVVGGPAITHKEATFIQKCFGATISSMFGALITRARNTPVGVPRLVKGDEFITCNLMVRKSCFEQVGGMDLRFFPGEEVSILRKLRALDFSMYYNPRMIVYRPRRESLLAFTKQWFSYGKVRSQLVFATGAHIYDAVYFLPALFLMYLLYFLVGHNALLSIPVAIYAFCALVSSLLIGFRYQSLALALCVPPLFPVLHLSYGAGVLFGILKYLVKEPRISTCSIRMTELQLQLASVQSVGASGYTDVTRRSKLSSHVP
jgi:succinoglycan biosynthesis protein ExoA